jgi:hypothetical protein
MGRRRVSTPTTPSHRSKCLTLLLSPSWFCSPPSYFHASQRLVQRHQTTPCPSTASRSIGRPSLPPSSFPFSCIAWLTTRRSMIMPRDPHTNVGDSEHDGGMQTYCSSSAKTSSKQGICSRALSQLCRNADYVLEPLRHTPRQLLEACRAQERKGCARQALCPAFVSFLPTSVAVLLTPFLCSHWMHSSRDRRPPERRRLRRPVRLQWRGRRTG